MARVRYNKALLLLSLLFIISFASPATLTNVAAQTSDEALRRQFEQVLKNISYDNIQQNVKFFSSLDSRVTGYPGFFEAVNYVVSKFNEYGIKPRGEDGTFFEWYEITAPIDYGANITLDDGTIIKGYNLWPNLVNPSPYSSPIEGDKLIYVGEGSFNDLEGLNLTDRFVLMNFDSRWFFRLSAMFGAKGIIYIGTDEASRMEALQKVYGVPIKLPRIWVSWEDGYKLKELCRQNKEISIKVNSFMAWERIKVPNVVGFIQGYGERANETIVLSAYLDSWSVVPALAPGATDSLGISVFLELARYLSQNRLSRSIILLAVSGHWEALWGAREYVERHFSEIQRRWISAFISMDLAIGSGQLGIANLGSSYAYRNIEILNGRYSWLVSRFFQAYLPAMQEILGENYGSMFVDQILNTYPAWIRGSLPIEIMGATSFDSEPYVAACYGGGFTYRTVNDARYYMKTPADTYEKVRWEMLWPQVQFIFCSFWGLINEPTISLPQNPSRMEATGEWGYCSLRIQVVQYNFTTAYWDPFDARNHPNEWKDTIVHFVTSTVTTGVGAVTPVLGVGVFGTPTLGTTGFLDIISLVDENGQILVKGVKPYSGGMVDAFVVNRTNGRIEWATDLGPYAAPGPVAGLSSRQTSITTTESFQMISMFKCGSIMIYSLFNPSDLSMIPGMLIYNQIAHGRLIWQSALASFYGDTMVFVQPNTPTELLITRGARFPIGVLLNSTEDKPLGYGYTVQAGQTLVLTYTPLIYARNMYWLNDGRVQTAYRYNTYNPSIVLFHNLANQYLERTESNLAAGKYGASYGNAYAAWAYEQQAYQATMDLIWQVIYTTIFFSIALIPFGLLVERLAFGYEGIKRVSTSLVVFAGFMVVLGLFHPGFHLATNASLAIMAFGMMAIMVPSLAFIAGEASATAKSLREQLTGAHVAEISRASAVLQAFSTGVQNMKKRRFRTILTLVSLTLIVFALVTFTSLAAIPRPMIDKTPTKPLYQGIMLRKVSWQPIPEEMYYQVGVMSQENAIVAARGWMFPPTPPRGLASFAFSPQLLTKIGGVLFLSPEEAEITRVNDTVVRGRWLLPEDTYVCLISEVAANNLTKELGRPIQEGSTINFLGLDLKVIGIFDGKALWSGTTGIADLDGEAITPIIPIAMREGGVPAHFEGDRIMIMPFKLCLLLRSEGTRVNIESAAIKILDRSSIPDTAVALALRMQTNIFYSENENETRVVRYRAWFSATGMVNILIPAIIGGFTVLNMMLGAVHERMREISIYMAVGLSPLHVAGLFMAESVVHAMLSAILGYMTGIIGCWIFGTLNLYPEGFYPNYSSYFVLYVIGASAGVTIASCLYPSIKASRVVTPSLERRWKIPKPSGREWEIPLPFVATEEEVYGIFAFIEEFLLTHAVEGVGLFATFGEVKVEENRTPERDIKTLIASVRLAPFDVGITQRVTLTASALKGQRYNIVVNLACLTGLLSDWINSNRPFIDNLRKQFMIWRALPPSKKNEYVTKGQKLKKEPSASKQEEKY
ncbi:MAG: M28 family peptidase [Thermoproteota archaeon]